ncbi:LuxR C-terminal-related transcriptional regulator [Paenibacillus chartarius]|uniref:LuxR C-terminal-related transcriptional regulator n=1 Tax=Paenibacillus chartarius TaxID=747481 RepID=A0ABV6DVK7_9BACL
MITPELLTLFEGAYPSCLVTCSADGIPNMSNLTRVWAEGADHVMVANQLLNKTYRNITEHPLALLKMTNPRDFVHWELSVRFIRSESEGERYDRILQDLRAVSWMAGVPLSAGLRSVLIFEVLSVRPCVEEALHLNPPQEAYGDLLKVLAEVHTWSRLSYWVPQDADEEVSLQASRGVTGAGVEPSAFEAMKRLALLVRSEGRLVRLRNIRSQLRYLHSIRTASPEQGAPSPSVPVTGATPSSYLAFPIEASGQVIGIVCCEDTGGQAEAFSGIEDGYVELLAGKLGEALLAVSTIPEAEREAMLRQAADRARLQWAKAKDPFHTMLSARERQVAEQVARGLTNTEIAKRLFISPRTVTTHLERIYQKLQVTSRAALTRYVTEHELLAEQEERTPKNT